VVRVTDRERVFLRGVGVSESQSRVAFVSRFLNMENGGPSRTALITAYARAYHQIADDHRSSPTPWRRVCSASPQRRN